MSDVDRIAQPLQAALEELERRLSDFAAPIITRLRPGKPSAEVEAVLRAHGLEVPIELKILWGWHDGTDSLLHRDNRLVGGWHLFSLAQTAEHHRSYREVFDAPDVDPKGYPRGWFPTLLYSNGPFAAIDCTADDEERPLFIVDPHSELPADPPTAEFASLRQLIESLVLLFDLDCVVPDETLGGASVVWERIPAGLRHTTYW